MLLVLVIGQWLGDILCMKFSDIWDDYFYVIQEKIGSKIVIFFFFCFNVINWSLCDVVVCCCDYVVSVYLVYFFCLIL